MGCDIHIVLEHFDEKNEVWVGLHELGYMSKSALTGVTHDKSTSTYVGWRLGERDYNFFYALAGIRGHDHEAPHREPLGLPENMSSLSRHVLADNSDMHSPSWISARELIPILERVKEGKPISELVASKLEGEKPNLDLLIEWIDEDIEESDIHMWRIVFAFDN